MTYPLENFRARATDTAPSVLAVCLNPKHTFSKLPQTAVHLLAGQGVQGDAHCGSTVQHLYLKRKDPRARNLMQVHLLQSELFAELEAVHRLQAGDLGENITTAGLDLLHLPVGTRLLLGHDAIVELTGLRTPCSKMDTFQPGLLRAVTDTAAPPGQRGRAGVMASVLCAGQVKAGDTIQVVLPQLPFRALTDI